MKIMKKIIILELITILILSACEKVIEVDVPRKDSKLVVSSWLNKDKVIEVKVTKSFHILESPNNGSQGPDVFIVKNATPVIYENNISIDTLVYDAQSRSYKSLKNSKIRDGYTYSIKVSAAGFAEVTAQTIVPVQSVIAGLTHVKHARTNSEGEEMDDVIIKLDDPAGKNYYLVRIFPASYGPTNPEYPINCVSTTDKDLEVVGEDGDPIENDCLDGNYLLMKDVNFEGRQKQLRISASSFQFETRVNPGQQVARPYVKVFQITEDYFRYLKSYSAYQNSDDNPFAEPVNVYTNIVNGYGIFSAHTVAVDTLR
jgi:hypothetical protein